MRCGDGNVVDNVFDPDVGFQSGTFLAVGAFGKLGQRLTGTMPRLVDRPSRKRRGEEPTLQLSEEGGRGSGGFHGLGIGQFSIERCSRV